MRLLRKTVIDNPYVPKQPTEMQGVFLTAPVLEIMYGGAGGGGKSAALLMAALQYVMYPGYNAILFRNSYADLMLPDALIPMSHEWLSGTSAKWRETDHTWYFPSGARVVFGYMETDADRWRYKSAQFQFIGFDELTQFSRIQYLFLFSRLRRRMGVKVPLRMRSATNPGGPGHDWVKRRFIGEQGENGVFESIRHPDRLFIPAQLSDNPYLDQAAYIESLKELDSVTRAQILHGDWNIRPEGTQFKRAWFEGKIIDRMPCGILKAVRFWDLASTVKKRKRSDPDFTAGALILQGEDKNFYIGHVARDRGTPQKIERLVTRTAGADGYEVWVGMEEEGGSSGKIVSTHYRRTLEGYTFKPVHPSGDKVRRSDPFASACEAGNVYLIRGNWNDRFLDELCAFDGMTGHDDQVDAVVGGYTLLTRSPKRWGKQAWNKVFKSKRAPGRTKLTRADLLKMKLRGQYRSPHSTLYPDEVGDPSNN